MVDRNADIGKINNYEIRLYAPERKMQAAVVYVTGESWDRWSQLDWEPFDEDDERPENCNRLIAMFPNRPDCDWRGFWRIAAQLGEDATLMVIVHAHGAYVCVDTRQGGERRVSIDPAAVGQALTDRISRAIAVLDGRDA